MHASPRRAGLPLAGALLALFTAALLLMVTGSADAGSATPAKASPLVFGHRGAAGYRPEHTLASYELAARMGADFIEPDLVSTKDGVLVARHEPEIGSTSDVADHPEFADRETTKTVDGIELTGWFTEDFTLAELKTLRAKERIPDVRQRNTIYDGRYEIPTFQEVLDLRARLSEELGREIGVAPETKHPTYFQAAGLALEPKLVKALRKNGLAGADAPVVVQSFETENLKALNAKIDVPLVALLDEETVIPADVAAAGGTTTFGDYATPEGLQGLAAFADWVGPWKPYIVPTDAAGEWLEPTTFVEDAHAAGLKVVPYTFRNENQFLPPALRSSADPNAYGDAFTEYKKFFGLGVDGVFSDNPDTALAARAEWEAES
ncbi:MAG: glycerophosphoryl diester phosphodiesterase [Solirubrobacteraceae bacterium]|nr:glycerophosphoryl diester phosphodiesterase [Solirubrobacteraceae bacterium]